jgi:hypothetical protein
MIQWDKFSNMKVDVSFNIEDQTIRIVADGEG